MARILTNKTESDCLPFVVIREIRGEPIVFVSRGPSSYGLMSWPLLSENSDRVTGKTNCFVTNPSTAERQVETVGRVVSIEWVKAILPVWLGEN